MKRRVFLQSSLASGGLCAMSAMPATSAENPAAREYYELRTFLIKPERQAVLEVYLRDALIPALNRLGVKHVGAMTELPVPPAAGAAVPPPVTPSVTLVIPYQSLEQLSQVNEGLESDAQFQQAAAAYAAIPAAEPVYDRIESSLLVAFAGLPRLQLPATKSRLFNLRVYESHSEAAGLKKIEMFNRGEIAIFQRVGLTPVLFGQTLVGKAIPNLTYLLVFEDDAARTAAWNRFRSDPEWIKLKAIPEYEDKRIVSRITNRLLAPLPFSQI